MSKIRRELTALSEECEAKCREANWVGSNPRNPNFRLLYSSVESYETGNRIAILGMNPAGGPDHAKADHFTRPFKKPGYSAYLDDSWEDYNRGQHPLQRVIQGLAMILAGESLSNAMVVAKENALVSAEASTVLRNSPSGNIIPYRASNLRELPLGLAEHGERIGWRLLCLMQPKPRLIVTLANRVIEVPWRTILKNSGQPLKADYEKSIRKNVRRKYREVRLVKGTLGGALLIGLPAVVHDQGRRDVTKPMFDILAQRLMRHGLL